MALIIVGVVLVIIILWFISAQRKLVAMDENINNAMGQIGVQLSSRWDALTALLDLTKGYADHEYKTISDTIKMRTSINSNSSANSIVRSACSQLQSQQACFILQAAIT